jgi:hypothetical protein
MAKKQSSKKPSKKTAKAPKVDAAAATPKTLKTRARDPRLPAAGTVIIRTYKGKDHRVKVLEDSLEHEGTLYRSMTALARAVTGYAAISGPAWLGLTKERGPATSPDAAKETPAAPAKTRVSKRAAKLRRAGRDPQTAAPTDAAPEKGPAPEPATA